MVNYTATIFAESGSSLSPNMAAIVVGVIQLVGSYFSTVLVERAGRKVPINIDYSSQSSLLTYILFSFYFRSLHLLRVWDWHLLEPIHIFDHLTMIYQASVGCQWLAFHLRFSSHLWVF